MDKTGLVQEVADLFRASGHKVDISVNINHREIDVRAEETQSLVRKVILVECADYDTPVGVAKLQTDITKLRAAKEALRDDAVLMHVARHGYTPDASGYAAHAHIPAYSLADLRARLVNFEPYIKAVQADPLRPMILKEYQPNRIHYEHANKNASPAIDFLHDWLDSGKPWLTLLGDYGVGKSWTLKRFLYALVDEYALDPSRRPLPLFVPLQNFTKAFDFENLMLRTLSSYGISGVCYPAFQYLMRDGRIVFLLDSFDEMAQQLSREVVRQNLKELLIGITSHSRAIMTSRPSYFEGRAERLAVVDHDGTVEWHPLDRTAHEMETASSRFVQEQLSSNQFARICDLTVAQRKRLFEIVLGVGSPAHNKLVSMFNRFQTLEGLSQRAVIARLLTTVAATLSKPEAMVTIEGYPLLPEDIQTLNEAKIFEIVVYNCLDRDKGIGVLSSAQRLRFLRSFALFLQQRTRAPFAAPDEIRGLVSQLFQTDIRRSDTPQQVLEGYYRTCRRHSGLTTEGQFRDTSGQLDTPVDEADTESRVGFSHNSMREYLVADAIATHLKKGEPTTGLIRNVVVTDAVGDFFRGIAEHDAALPPLLRQAYADTSDDNFREVLFKLILAFVRANTPDVAFLGNPPVFKALDLSNTDLSGLNLHGARFVDCVALDTDLRKSDLRKAEFHKCILDNVSLDGALVTQADFRTSDVVSVYAFDEYDTRTSAVLRDKSARQWLYTRGAFVPSSDELNQLLGQPWYEAAREVTKTLESRIGGTHQDVSLAKGTRIEYRQFAQDFTDYLLSRRILERVAKSKTGPGDVVILAKEHRDAIVAFSRQGVISPVLRPFFDKHLAKRKEP